MGDRASRELEIVSRLAASPASVWASVRTIDGVNRELWPFVKMTCPYRDLTLDSPVVPLGTRAFRSYLLLFGIFPFDYDDVTIAWIDPGRGFLETSTMLSMKRWQHEREVIVGDDGRGSVITDRIAFEPRAMLRPLTPALRAICSALFRWRHKRLRALFGSVDV